MLNRVSPSTKNLGCNNLIRSCIKAGDMLLKNEELPID